MRPFRQRHPVLRVLLVAAALAVTSLAGSCAAEAVGIRGLNNAFAMIFVLAVGPVAFFGGLAALVFGPKPRWVWALPPGTLAVLLFLHRRSEIAAGRGEWVGFGIAEMSALIVGVNGMATLLIAVILYFAQRERSESPGRLRRLRTWVKHHGEVWLVRPFADDNAERDVEIIGRWDRSGMARPSVERSTLPPLLEKCLAEQWAPGGQYVMVSVRWKGTRSMAVAVTDAGDPDISPTARRRELMSSVMAQARTLAARHAALSQRETGLKR